VDVAQFGSPVSRKQFLKRSTNGASVVPSNVPSLSTLFSVKPCLSGTYCEIPSVCLQTRVHLVIRWPSTYQGVTLRLSNHMT
jgi:hypothetical protein